VSADLGTGSTFGLYRIESLLGRGGMSVVYLAEDTRLGRRVAIKVLSAELAADDAFRSRFVRESQLAAGLEHPNIVPVYEAGEAEGQLFIAMRYVRGTDLRTLLTREGPFDPDRTIALLRPVAAALDAAHRRGLVHRDVKPANILIANDEGEEHVYLSDFGLSKHTSSRSGLTKTGTFMGTVDYVAPEQIQGHDVDGRTDGYSLACVLFECLTAKVPFAKDSDVATLFGHIQDPPPRVTQARESLPREIDEVIAQGMAKNPDDRPQTATALIDRAARALGSPSGPKEAPSVPAAPTILAPPPPAPGWATGAAPPASAPGTAPPVSAPGTAPPVPSTASAPPPTRGGSNNARLIAIFGAAGLVIAAILVIVGLTLSGDDGGPVVPAPSPASPTPAPPIEAANASAVTIPNDGTANPYPAPIEVSGATGTISGITVTLTGFSHAFPEDVDVLLVGPSGANAVLMADVGGGNRVRDLTLTFDDAAGVGLPDRGLISSGTFVPSLGTDRGGGSCCDFQGGAPAPSPPFGTALSVFEGTDPNGAWNLFVFDDSASDAGQIAGGWSLVLETGEAGAVSPAPATGATGPTGATLDVVLQDDFSDPASGWDVFEDRLSSGGYVDGAYQLGVEGSFRVIGDFNTSSEELASLGDVRVEVTARLLTNSRDALYGLACRAATPDRYYYFLIGGNGKFFIGENDADGASNFDVGVTPSVERGRAPNRIAIECADSPEGVTLRMFVNGIAVNTLLDTEDTISTGAAGFVVESGQARADAAFDDFLVARL